MSRLLRHKQRPVNAITKRPWIIPNRKAVSLPPSLGKIYEAALTPGEISGTVTRTGFDSRPAGDGPIGEFSQQPGDFNNQSVQYLFHHWENETFYFGTDTSEQFGFTQDPILIAIQGLGFNIPLEWSSVSTGFWKVDNPTAETVGKYLRTRIGVKLAVLVGQ